MSKFKIGDWVRDTRNGELRQFSESTFNIEANYSDLPYELWKPYINEWCWCVCIDNYDKQHRDLIKWNERMNVLDFDIVEPFIGTLPTFLQGK